MNGRSLISNLLFILAGSVSIFWGQQSGKNQPAPYALNVGAIPATSFNDGYYSIGHLNTPNANHFPRIAETYPLRADGDVFFIPKYESPCGYSVSAASGIVASPFSVAGITPSSEARPVFVNPFARPSNLVSPNLVSPVERTDRYCEPAIQFTAAMADNVGPGYSDRSLPPVIATERGDPTGQSQPSTAPLPEKLSGSDDDSWHISVSPYLWLPGVHGTIGAFGRNADFRASPSDLLSHFRFGLLGSVEARRQRMLTNMDLMFLRLRADRALPFPPGLLATSAQLTANMFILTPKVGFRLIDATKLKADFLTGFRYWHFGETLQFSPSPLGLNFSKAQNWVDPLVGGRIAADLSRKTVFTLAGDVGGWGAGSQLEYQIVGLLGYKLNPAMTLLGGYRYLYVDYQKGGQAGAIVTTAMSGVVLGVTLNLK
jgi:hypothetical protein